METACILLLITFASGFDGVFRLTDFGNCPYDVATCVEVEI